MIAQQIFNKKTNFPNHYGVSMLKNNKNKTYTLKKIGVKMLK
tara:strand:- start:33679 stop:33804 length:126 start_codon:yes stop_codon:yes gene_type:complete